MEILRILFSKVVFFKKYNNYGIMLKKISSINLPLVIFQALGKNGLSPGYFNMKFSNKMDDDRVKKIEKTSLPETKRRRLFLKQERANQKDASEVSEGSTYQSG